MGIWRLESFDHYATADLEIPSMKFYAATRPNPGGGQYHYVEIGAGKHSQGARIWADPEWSGDFADLNIYFTNPGADEMLCGFWFQISELPGDYDWNAYPDTDANGLAMPKLIEMFGCRVLVTHTGQIKLTARLSGYPIVGTSLASIAPGTWYYLELKINYGVGGSAELRIDGDTWLTVTNEEMGTPDNFFTMSSCGGGPIATFDDLYIVETALASDVTDFIGPHEVRCLFPEQDGDSTEWTPKNGGAHYIEVDDPSVDRGISYVETDTAGNVDLYHFEDAPDGEVLAAQLVLAPHNTVVGTDYVRAIVKSAGSQYAGPNLAFGNGWQFVIQTLGENPVASEPWTVAAINAAQFGFEKVI